MGQRCMCRWRAHMQPGHPCASGSEQPLLHSQPQKGQCPCMAAWSRQSHLLSSGVPQSLPVRTCIAPTTSDTAAADADAPGEYFDYCIDDLGLQDMRAADAKIRELADAELGPRQAALWLLESFLDCSVTV